MLKRLTLLAGGVLFLAAFQAEANSVLVDDLFGRGAHAYFSGDFTEAHELLTAAVENESNDPRAYYFRGLVYTRLGRPEQARLDFQQGGRLEMVDSNAFYDASKALERIQGPERITIEKYRAAARVAAIKRSEDIHRARFEAIRSQEDRVLRRHVNLTPAPIEPEEPTDETVPDNEASRPAATPAADQPAEEANPFDQPAAAPKAAVEEPADEEPAEEAPAAKAAPAKADEDAAEADPFGDAAPAKEAPAAKAPAAPAKAAPAAPAGAAEADPFAAGPASTPTQPAAKETPAKEPPAAPAKPAASEPEKDPFASDTPGPVQGPAVAPPEKTAGSSPVTRPATGPATVSPSAPSTKQQASTPAKAATKEVPPAAEPEKSDPFVEEPMTAGKE